MALTLLAHWSSAHSSSSWLSDLPVMNIGSALFTTGLIAIFFEYVDEADAEVRPERLRKVLVEEAPATRDAVVDGFAFAPDSLRNVASP
ncbi:MULTISPECIES: hypothetical protein [unclassified Streptomyces]|uniref:hypothetical protein n=1 Tax=unclassified Streptomyces TaxID=2593676 RepID=UPI000B8093EF|nr:MULTISPECIES: hypothetical protein [unclassified Streptomyces]MYS21214.1 hypothetical protein [Streptomyces sp. SID4948]